MSKREWKLYVEDILEPLALIRSYYQVRLIVCMSEVRYYPYQDTE